MRCPCRKKSETATYAQCCAPYHLGARIPETAEALMRSRYSAFALENSAYLSATWHLSTRPTRIGFNPSQVWLMLKVHEAQENGDKATVEFTARSRIGGASHVLHEVSRFIRENGRWYYVDGAIE